MGIIDSLTNAGNKLKGRSAAPQYASTFSSTPTEMDGSSFSPDQPGSSASASYPSYSSSLPRPQSWGKAQGSVIIPLGPRSPPTNSGPNMYSMNSASSSNSNSNSRRGDTGPAQYATVPSLDFDGTSPSAGRRTPSRSASSEQFMGPRPIPLKQSAYGMPQFTTTDSTARSIEQFRSGTPVQHTSPLPGAVERASFDISGNGDYTSAADGYASRPSAEVEGNALLNKSGGGASAYDALETVDSDSDNEGATAGFFGRRTPARGASYFSAGSGHTLLNDGSKSAPAQDGKMGFHRNGSSGSFGSADLEKAAGGYGGFGVSGSPSSTGHESTRPFFSRSSTSKSPRHHKMDRNESFAESVASGKYAIQHKSENIAVSRAVPNVEDPQILLRHKIDTARKLAWIIGGWSFFIIVPLLFKGLALKYNLAADDRTAAWVKRRPTVSTQVWTVIGNITSEFIMILWEMSISYFAVRRLAYGNQRTELLTWAAWSELKRAGYTMSGRKPQWPIWTIFAWFGFFFIAPGFTTLLTPQPMTAYTNWTLPQLDYTAYNVTAELQNRNIFPWEECGFLPNENDIFRLDDGTVLNRCPSIQDPISVFSAGLASLRTAYKLGDAVVNYPKAKFVESTLGVVAMGPNGSEPGPFFNKKPGKVHSPDGYDFNYTITQQGQTVDVECHEATAKDEQDFNITWTWTELGNVGLFGYKCKIPQSHEELQQTFYTVNAGAVIAARCGGQNDGAVDLDYHSIYLKSVSNFPADPHFNNTVYQEWWDEKHTYLRTDIVCNLRPKLVTVAVDYSSATNLFTPRIVENAPVIYNSDVPYEIQSLALFNMSKLPVQSANIAPSPLIQGGIDPNVGASTSQVIAFRGGNYMMTAMSAFSYSFAPKDQNTEGLIDPTNLKPMIKGMYEYLATTQREFLMLAIAGRRNDGSLPTQPTEIEKIDGVKQDVFQNVPGEWRAQTVGWGPSPKQSKDPGNSTVVFASLVPIWFFAAVSFGLIAYSHYYDRSRQLPVKTDCDPTDFVDAVIAAAQGGLHNSFARETLTHEKGNYGARKVKMVLGHIYHRGESEPRMGFVDLDKEQMLEAERRANETRQNSRQNSYNF